MRPSKLLIFGLVCFVAGIIVHWLWTAKITVAWTAYGHISFWLGCVVVVLLAVMIKNGLAGRGRTAYYNQQQHYERQQQHYERQQQAQVYHPQLGMLPPAQEEEELPDPVVNAIERALISRGYGGRR